ncbi:MAG: ornithine carbamoyltransferase [Desulfobacterales bacterium]|nr:ornithine carbamoyltransferase [Desulfobacterales bacterium]MBS3754627.1 ornithine carbamoyltransferase [Desulfobacterales bacterium]
MKKDILTLVDLAASDFDHLFSRAGELKHRRKQGISDPCLAGRTVGLIFEKASTRTRISFEAAAAQLGGTSLFISSADTQLARQEPIADTARVLERYLDALVLRTFSQEMQAEFARIASIPVINALTDTYHPCQVLSDLMTVIEFKGGYSGIRVAWVGDGNNMAQSWINAAAVLGFELILACPEGYMPEAAIVERARSWAGNKIRVVHDPAEAVENADVVNTDVWASMGQESEEETRRSVFAPFQVNRDLMTRTAKDAIVMHCLPAHKGEEITEEVFESGQSVVWDQAENKMHMHKAILEMLIIGQA